MFVANIPGLCHVQQRMTTTSKYLSVTDLHRAINMVLESDFARAYFTGEICEVNLWSSGHLYFTLKDSESQIPCVMWRSAVTSLRFKPKAGDVVLCAGRPNVYNKNGRFQMVVATMETSGAGVLQQKFLELKARLEKEGLFSEIRKRPLPFLPKVIGVVTSGQGAVIHDIMVRIASRMPHLIVYLADVKVQGPGAAEEIASGIRRLNSMPEVELIIVARGGGSLEDLWAFNEEITVRAIYASRVPIVSGVGHEVDVTLSDLVADVRAPTPTAAAEMVVPHRDELLRAVTEFERRLRDTDRWLQPLGQAIDDAAARLSWAAQRTLGEAMLRVDHASTAVKNIHPARVLSQQTSKIELLWRRLGASGDRHLSEQQRRLEKISNRLQTSFPSSRIEVLKSKLSQGETKLRGSYSIQFQRKEQHLLRLDTKLQALNPMRVLERGFAIVYKDGIPTRNAAGVAAGDNVQIKFTDGNASAIITESSKSA